MNQTFDFDKALSELQAGKDLTGKDGVLIPFYLPMKLLFTMR